MNKRLLAIGVLILISTCALLLIFSTTSEKTKQRAFRENREQKMQVFAVDIPAKADFAGEAVPLDLYWVREALDRELLTNVYWHSSTFLGLKRAHRHFPLIEKVLKENGIPLDFMYLVLAESNFSHQVSPAGASGYWQFMKETAKRYDLEVSEEIDERYHLKKSTQAACRYLKEAYGRFGSWTLAAAAYNAGPDNIAKAMAQQQAGSFYELLLNSETTRYLFRVLAFKEIYNNPPLYGFYLRASDYYPPIPSREISIDSSISDLASFAKQHGLNYKLLKEFNPWLRKNTLTNSKKKVYLIEIPDYQHLFYSHLMKGVNDSI